MLSWEHVELSPYGIDIVIYCRCYMIYLSVCLHEALYMIYSISTLWDPSFGYLDLYLIFMDYFLLDMFKRSEGVWTWKSVIQCGLCGFKQQTWKGCASFATKS